MTQDFHNQWHKCTRHIRLYSRCQLESNLQHHHKFYCQQDGWWLFWMSPKQDGSEGPLLFSKPEWPALRWTAAPDAALGIFTRIVHIQQPQRMHSLSSATGYMMAAKQSLLMSYDAFNVNHFILKHMQEQTQGRSTPERLLFWHTPPLQYKHTSALVAQTSKNIYNTHQMLWCNAFLAHILYLHKPTLFHPLHE